MFLNCASRPSLLVAVLLLAECAGVSLRSAETQLEAVKEKGAQNYFVLRAADGYVQGLSSDNGCQVSGGALQYSKYVSDATAQMCEIQVRFNSGLICKGSVGLYEDGSYYKMKHIFPSQCLKVQSSTGNNPSGAAWPCQYSGCWNHMHEGYEIVVAAGNPPIPKVKVYWKRTYNDASTTTITTSSSSESTKKKAESLDMGVKAEVSYGPASISGEIASKTATSTKEFLKSASSVSQTINVAACPAGFNRWQYVVQVDDVSMETRVTMCISGNYAGPQCPAPLCKSKEPDANDCQCCQGMAPAC
uniref:Uncharacterized protein n=1 Tax=Chromera velia CCMP2878 TaxID=1169474 RepID=A0A0G4GC24_9ALVE|eukprot:Cvel_21124.t1-p1 / transcript=Cvel_21124.t1 / gene=Cvel_21124 / organism=Chromera_velia_CCMP2878 / gene_product=hypothetical protein / transcript_product=hypothetical protein / location=Cvel_scaffold1956:20225-22255(-) / protein_length=302 / sequence_SO=supercontig / SO=protein_coding / is_pseudo=false